jgi:CRISPR-associated protein Cas2
VTVVVTQRVTPATRGFLTRWLLEVSSGVFVGSVSKRVREGLWAELCSRRGLGAITLIHRAPNEQGFAVLVAGQGRRELRDFDGLTLLAAPLAKRRGSTRTDL